MKLNYTEVQHTVFFPDQPVKFTVVRKGRRVGLTRGAAMAFIEYSLTRAQRLLWGETIFSNVQRYLDLYFTPILEELPKGSWEWRPRIMQLKIMDSIIDFRSADNPDAWEGFGYNVIFLNEAGIILRNPTLYTKTVLPMLIDYEGSVLIAAGVPKGKKLKDGTPHPFFALYEKAEQGLSNYRTHKFSSYTNPFLRKADIDEIADALDDKMQQQEIFGEFIDTTDSPYLYAFENSKHIGKPFDPDPRLHLWFSFDFNIEPNSCIVGQKPNDRSGIIFDEISVKGGTEEVCAVLIAKYSHWINKGLIFVTGDATGKSRNAMSGELTNYIVIKKALKLKDYNMKQRGVNMLLKSSRVLCNSVLSKGDIKITPNCKQTISDCQVANVDGGGELIKETGMHKLDCFRYLVDSWFPDFLDKPHKYINKVIIPAPTNGLIKHIYDKTI